MYNNLEDLRYAKQRASKEVWKPPPIMAETEDVAKALQPGLREEEG